MKIFLHIGLPHCGGERLQQVLDDKRGLLAKRGIVFPRAGGGKNHTRLYMAVSDPGAVDALRHARGQATPGAQARLRAALAQDLAAEARRHDAQTLILSATQLATLPSRSALERLRALLLPLSDDIHVVLHLDEQARLLARHYAEAVLSGRTAPLTRELELARAGGDWRAQALEGWRDHAPERQGFPDVQAVPFWLDYAGLIDAWEEVFGPGRVRPRGYDPARFNGTGVLDEIREAFEIEEQLGKVAAVEPAAPASGVTLARQRQLNEVFVRLLDAGKVIPRPLWRALLGEVAHPGEPIAPGALADVSRHFAAANKALLKAHPGLDPACLKRARPRKPWAEPDPQMGFRATQYAAAFLPRIERASRDARPTTAQPTAAQPATGDEPALSPAARRLFTPRALENYKGLIGGRFVPHNDLPPAGEDQPAPPYTPAPPRHLPEGSSGRVIVGCMKDEAPYILEWIAYHRAIGVDDFIIYTNACSDGTPEILERLQELGIAQHRNNDNWKGNSPQQHALNQSLKEPVIENAEWVIHIDVDEFINVRVGNGTLDDFFARVPDATNVAMTWRLFGHNGVRALSDRPVIAQFDHAAPKYCPKPHTVWGFKTMVKNIGAYGKLSCHRPNKLRPEAADKVLWVNGSGRPMGPEVAEKGWRSSLKTIGYDLIQLNHYALRSAESYLIKRQRGRALHVDRSIGINYWVRMDWSDYKDVTIQRNLPRMQAELARLMADPELARLHRAGCDWHRAKAAELHQNPEFEALYQLALETRLTPLERVAYALALDMES